MGLSNDLISQFVKAAKSDDKTSKEVTVYGTTVEHDGTTYVKLDGSDLLTPVSTTSDTKPGERVTVMIKNHTATVTGNMSSPAARTDSVKELGSQITEFEIVMAYKVTTEDLEAINATIENLKVTAAKLKDAEIVNAEIHNLEAKFAELEYVDAKTMEAINADIEHLEATFADFEDISTEDLEAANAEIDKLKGYTADFTYVSADVLQAIRASIEQLDVEKLSAEEAEIKYANIDFSNIGKAAMEYLYTTSGLIKDVKIGDATISGELVGVTLKGDLIEGNTIKADKLVIKGSDGIYYKLNFEAGTFKDGEAVPTDSLHGSVITAKSVTAEKVSVNDLVAFDATIGGFKITDEAIHSVVKESVDNTTRGIYMDNDGQFAVGDAINFLKYHKTRVGNQLATFPDTGTPEINGVAWSCKDGVFTAKGTSTGVSPTSGILRCTVTGWEGPYTVSGAVENNTPAYRTVSGESVVVNDSIDEKLQGLKLYGKSEQFTTTGAQLYGGHIQKPVGATELTTTWTNTETSTVNDNVLCVQVEAGDVFANGAFVSFISDAEVGVQSCIQLQGLGANNWGASVYHTIKKGYNELTLPAYSFVDGQTGVAIQIRRASASPVGEWTFTLTDFFVKAGQAYAPYEPYTGGIPSPNPEYPQDIVSAGADGEIGVNVYGGNLLDIQPQTTGSMDLTVHDNQITITNLGGSRYHAVAFLVSLPAGAHTMSVDSFSGTTTSGYLIELKNSSNGTSIENLFLGKTTATFTLEEPAIVRVVIYSGNETVGATYTITGLRLCAGSTALPWEPYKGQSFTAQTPNGLPGIQVSSGGNYTDSDGQQWVCDYIDFARGVYVQRVDTHIFTGDEALSFYSGGDSCLPLYKPSNCAGAYAMCVSNLLVNAADFYSLTTKDNTIATAQNSIIFHFAGIMGVNNEVYPSYGDLAVAIQSKLKELVNADTPLTVLYQLATPIETPLTDEELAQYATLRSYQPTTTVLNDEGIGMEVSYAVDVVPKAYAFVKKDDEIAYYTDKTFTLDGTEDIVEIYCQLDDIGVTVDATIKPMLNEGTEALPWEPFKGGYMYKLEISADSIVFAADNRTIDDVISDQINEIRVGARNLIRNSTNLIFSDYYFSGDLVIEHDGEGNVTITCGATLTDDGNGNVIMRSSRKFTDDGNGNVTIT